MVLNQMIGVAVIEMQHNVSCATLNHCGVANRSYIIDVASSYDEACTQQRMSNHSYHESKGGLNDEAKAKVSCEMFMFLLLYP